MRQDDAKLESETDALFFLSPTICRTMSLYFNFSPPAPRSLLDHDLVVWLGDLNYRLTSNISLEEAYKRIAQGPEGRSSIVKSLEGHFSPTLIPSATTTRLGLPAQE